MEWRDRGRGKRSPEDAFADEVAHLIPQLLAVEKVERGDGFSLKLTMAGGPPRVLNLHNVFAEASRLEGAARSERLRRAVLAISPSDRPTTWAQARGRLLPSLRSASWVAALTVGGHGPLRRVFSPFILLLVAIDDDNAMSFVTDDDIRTWDVGWTEIIAAAMANLTRNAAPIGAASTAPCVDVLGPDGYASSWLTAPLSLAQAGRALWGDFVAVAASRDSLRLIAADDRAFLARELERLLSVYLTEPRHLSPVPFAVCDGRLGPWKPEKIDPCRPLVDRLAGMLALKEYGLQTNVLADMMHRCGADVFVANYMLVERDDKTVWSWAAWPKQVTDGLLPKADFICLGDASSKSNLWVRWDDAWRVAGDALREEPGYYPARWRVRGWPTGAVMARLQQLAIDPATGEHEHP